ncbi:glycoside hydrolase family 1 protein [Candidatus Falkowbacteria bacterium]|nr:glycoside hydrolase family 1 protein [Candidatus Falkowbacteria bacterium]
MNGEKNILVFPQGFLWGVSTAAHQIEGGNTNDWSEWESSQARIDSLKAQGHEPEHFISGQACDSYNRYETDFDLVAQLNCGAYRMGIEWARIEPEEGKWNMAELEHYRQAIKSLKARNLKLVLTLWHWTNPVWLAKLGGWRNPKSVDYYLRYVEFIVKELGADVDFWVTLNEPMAHVGFGYVRGNFPPNRKFDIIGAVKVFRNLVSAHIGAYGIIHHHFPEASVGYTSLTDYFEPANKFNPLDLMFNSLSRWLHHRAFLNKVSRHLDYIGIDYYFHNRISWRPPFKVNLNKEVNDMGWEVYPEGIYHVVKYAARFKKPIYIMENGIADADDDQRPQFIENHLRWLHKAIEAGCDVRGYFHWSLLDNFEWAHGFHPKFGLFAVDLKTCERTARPSAALYADICKNNYLVIR